MAYERLHWVESETPLSADNMNNIEDGIEELQSQKVDKVSGKGLSDQNYTSDEKTKLAGIAAGAQVNQDAFGTIKVGSTRLEANSPASTLTVSSGNHILMLPIASDNSVQIVTDIEDASSSTKGLMSASDKIKLNLTFSYQNLDAFTGIEFRDTSGNEVYGLAIVGFTITNNALRVLVRNVSSSNITLGTGTKAYAKKFS